VQNGRQVDLPARVERVRRKTRPWKSIIALLLAIAAAVISRQARHGAFTTSDLTSQLIAYGTAVLFLVFAFTTLVITLLLFGVDVSQLVLGGAITTVFLSIAAQQALGNVFAGLVLVFARPFKVGDEVRLQAGALGGTLDGIVTDIGITYVRFSTDGRVMSIPNSQVLNAVVGPVPPGGEDSAVAEDGRSGTPGGPGKPQPGPPGPA